MAKDIISNIEYKDKMVYIEVNQDYNFCVSIVLFKQNRLNIGESLDFADYKNMLYISQKKEALHKAVAYIAIRDRSQKEIKDFLNKKGYEYRIISYVIEKLAMEKLLNDASFAEKWVESRINAGLGKRKIMEELNKKGIDREYIDLAFQNCNYEDIELENAMALAAKLVKNQKDISYEQKQKIAQNLTRKGYSASIAITAINKICNAY